MYSRSSVSACTQDLIIVRRCRTFISGHSPPHHPSTPNPPFQLMNFFLFSSEVRNLHRVIQYIMEGVPIPANKKWWHVCNNETFMSNAPPVNRSRLSLCVSHYSGPARMFSVITFLSVSVCMSPVLSLSLERGAGGGGQSAPHSRRWRYGWRTTAGQDPASHCCSWKQSVICLPEWIGKTNLVNTNMSFWSRMRRAAV